MKRVVHFELPYADIKRASEFYQKVFGWKISDASIEGMEYYAARTGPIDEQNMATESGFINGALMPKNDMVAVPVIVIQVDDIQEALKMVEEHGGRKLMEPVTVGDMGHYVYVKDTEDNIVGIWQDKKS